MTRPGLLLLALFLGVGCAEPLDTTRVVPERGTLGEELFGIFHRDMVRETPRRAAGFEGQRDAFVGTVDHLFPPEELRYTQDFLVRLLPLYDDGTLPSNTKNMAAAVTRMLDDEEALRSLTAILQRVGYVDLDRQEALLRRIAAYPKYRELTRALIDLALAHDGLDAAGNPDPNEPNELTVLQGLMAERLADLELSEDAERDIVLMADLLLSEDPRLGGGQEVLIVRRDPRGMAQVATVGGRLVGPFVDQSPQDGLPDVDLDGRFLGDSGQSLDLPPFSSAGPSRDAQGRLLASDGGTVYEYTNLDRTLLARVLRDGRTLIDEEVPMKAVRTLDEILGERDDEGRYQTYDNPLLDLLYAAGHAADMRELPDVLEMARDLVAEHEPTLGWTLVELEAQADIADRYPGGLKPGSSFQDDLINWVRKLLLVPGLAEDVLEVIYTDPAVRGLTDATVTLAQHKKGLIRAQDYDAQQVFTTLVDRTQADVAGNQSLAQRLFHLIKDTKGARYEPRLIGIPLGFIFQIDDLAEFYLLSIIGESEIPSLVSTLTGLPTQPTPVDLARFINQEQDFGNPKGNEGIDVMDNDGDTLFAVSASGMDNALRPLVQVFYSHGQLDLLFELFEILHVHWASTASDYQDGSPAQPRYSKLSGIAKFEPMLIEMFTQAKVLDSVIELLKETEPMRVDSGRSAHQLILAAARKVMNKQTSLRTRDGESSVRIDNKRVTPLSPFDLIRGALQGLDAKLDQRARTRAEWNDITDALSDLYVGVERTGPTSGRLENPTAVPVLLHVLDFAIGRAKRHDDLGDLSTWIREDMLGIAEDALTSKELPAIFDVIYAIDADETVNAAMTDLRDELMDEQRGFADLLVTAGDGLAAAKDASIAGPMIRFLGREMDPEVLHLFNTLSLCRRSMELDPDEHLLEVARRGLEESADTHDLYLYGLTGAVRQANRIDPLSDAPMSLDDVRAVMTKTRDYLLDEEHGVEKFYDLVHHRKLENQE